MSASTTAAELHALAERARRLRLPDFLVIGAAKSGTSSLCGYLRMHPRVSLSMPKEPQFFAAEFNWHKGLDWYAAHFADAGDALAVGEGSTTYTRYPHSRGVPERIAAILPNVRLLYLVRHPIERMISQYQQHLFFGWETDRSADRALLAKPLFLDTSRYATQIERYLEHFPRERLLILISEDLRTRRADTMRRAFSFLGVDADVELEDLDREYNTTADHRRPRPIDGALRRVPGYDRLAAAVPLPVRKLKYRLTTRGDGPKPVVSDAVRRELEERLADEVRRLRPLVGAGFDGWGIA